MQQAGHLGPSTDFGGLVTVGHLVAIDGEDHLVTTGDIDAPTINGLWPGYTTCYPMQDNSAAWVITAFKHFRGCRKIELLNGGKSKHIRRAANTVRINLEHSQPGVPQSSRIAARNNRDILAGTRTALVAGLPA